MMSTFALGHMQIRRSGYGAMQLAGPYAFGAPPDRAAAIGVLQAAVAAGVDHIDTAQYYGPGVVNDLIRKALHPCADGLAIVSKVAVRRHDSGAVLPFGEPHQLREGIEDNLRSLRVDQLAAVNLRLPGDGGADARSMTSWPRWWRLATRASSPRLASAMSASDSFGTPWQGPISSACRTYSTSPTAAGSSSCGVPQPWNRVRAVCPLGWPRGQENPVLTSQVVTQTAARLSITPAQVALRWLLQLAPNVLLIPGTGSVCPPAGENLAAEGVTLDDEALRQLDGIGA
jgi:pyridoxine 4-dehydrogenase